MSRIMVAALLLLALVGCASRGGVRPQYDRVTVENPTPWPVVVYVTLDPSRISARRLGRVMPGHTETFEIRLVRDNAYLDVRFSAAGHPSLLQPLPLWRADQFRANIAATGTELWVRW